MFKERNGRIKANASPLLFPTYDVLETTFPGVDEDELGRLARSIRTDDDMIARLGAAAVAAGPVYTDSGHVEQQLCNRFIPDPDKVLMQQFHAVPWEQRTEIAGRFSDDRLKRLGQRAIYFEAPHLVADTVRSKLDEAVGGRWTGDALMPWMTASKALAELESIDPDQRDDDLNEYARILQTRFQIASGGSSGDAPGVGSQKATLSLSTAPRPRS